MGRAGSPPSLLLWSDDVASVYNSAAKPCVPRRIVSA